ncbi:hypothetical protein [Castellaniella sp.]|uniref:hypothetical protein n=1 Tax=Castellaniella sp. TaxID=1955812 RepID=UPI003A93BC20
MNKQTQTSPVTLEQAKRAVIKLVLTRGRGRAVAALALFGIENLTQLHPSKYSVLVTVCQRIQQATTGVQA